MIWGIEWKEYLLEGTISNKFIFPNWKLRVELFLLIWKENNPFSNWKEAIFCKYLFFKENEMQFNWISPVSRSHPGGSLTGKSCREGVDLLDLLLLLLLFASLYLSILICAIFLNIIISSYPYLLSISFLLLICSLLNYIIFIYIFMYIYLYKPILDIHSPPKE